MKRWLLAAACGVVALGLLLYPLVGELLSEKYHSDIETNYTAAIEDTDDTELTAQRQAAEQYNAMLANTTISEGGASAPPLAYTEQLTVGGAMAYVDIPQIGVYLPVQHGTGAETLEKSVGHVVGTSLPVGGSSTHAVLSAHSGMASSKLFSDIDQLEKGDTFYVHVLGEVLATPSTRYCRQIRACCKLRLARIWSRWSPAHLSASTPTGCWYEAIECRMYQRGKRLPPQKSQRHPPGRSITSPALALVLQRRQ